jgi:hypothetical protein
MTIIVDAPAAHGAGWARPLLPVSYQADAAHGAGHGSILPTVLQVDVPDPAVLLDLVFTVGLRVYPLPVAAPAPQALLQRVSEIYPAPDLDDLSRPIDWVPTSTVQEDWGSFQIVFGGVDVTFLRGMATELGPMVWNEPFGDDTVDIIFPQITPFDSLGAGDLAWLRPGAPIEVYKVNPDGSIDHENPLFEGRFGSEEDNLAQRVTGTGQGGQQGTEQQASYLTCHCLGAIYCADLEIKTPAFIVNVIQDPTNPGTYIGQPQDIGLLISGELNRRSQVVADDGTPGRQTVQLARCKPVMTGCVVTDNGSGTQLVNGYFQDLLAQGSVAPQQTDGSNITGIALRPDDGGYWLVGDDSSVLTFGPRTFYGGNMLGQTLDALFSDIVASPSGLGYAICAEDGGVFCFGDFPFQGSLPSIDVTPTGAIVGIARTPSGLGYWMADEVGHVFSFGDAVYHGGDPFGAAPIVGIAATPTGSGYFLIDQNGSVYAYGAAVYAGGASGTGHTFAAIACAGLDQYWCVDTLGNAYGFNLATFAVGLALLGPITGAACTDGDGLTLCGDDGGVFALGDDIYHGSTIDFGGEWECWTLSKLGGRLPVIHLKDRWTVHATMRVGQPGVQLGTLLLDGTTSRNAIYGEGTTPVGTAALGGAGGTVPTGGHTWRNTMYPNERPNAAPVLYPGFDLTPGMVNAKVEVWAQAMKNAGWALNVSTLFDRTCLNACRAFQLANGLQPTGTVNAQTWGATFNLATVDSISALLGAYIAPLAEVPGVEPFTYDPYGGVNGRNPAFDPELLRVEGWETFGAGVDKTIGVESAHSEIMRDGTAGYVGVLTLYADPNEMSRYDLRPGMNLLLENFRGRDVFLHIAQVKLDWHTQGRPVTLTVDEHAQDLITVATMRTADRSTTDPVRRTRHNRRASRIIPDRTSQFDVEAGAGLLPVFVLQGGLWNVVRIPASAAGSVIELHASTDPATAFSVAVFNQPISPLQLVSLGIGNPLAPFDVNNTSMWVAYASQLTQMGLVIAWGQVGDACGYSPGQESDAGAVLSGIFTDQGAWQYQSLIPPWLWVALWAETTCTLRGMVVDPTTGIASAAGNAQMYPEPVFGM